MRHCTGDNARTLTGREERGKERGERENRHMAGEEESQRGTGKERHTAWEEKVNREGRAPCGIGCTLHAIVATRRVAGKTPVKGRTRERRGMGLERW